LASSHDDRPSLAYLSSRDAFVARHIGPDETEIAKMLEIVGAGSLEALSDAVVPPTIRSERSLDLPPAIDEAAALATLRAIAETNEVVRPLIGMGYHDTVTPPVLRRMILENPSWYTAYTPYQPEISQGRLELLLAFQTMVSDLTGRELANASLLDEATAAAEAMTLLRRVHGDAVGERFVVDEACHPQTIAVVATRAEPLGIEIVVTDPAEPVDGAFGLLVQQPTTTGALRDLGPLVAAAHERGALVAAAVDLLACCVVTPPGDHDVDVVVASTQRFGVPLGFGGPHAAALAVREEYQRALPGRLVGVSRDVDGRPALRLALQTREQHIRRQKATSNICTAQVLLAVVAAAYGAYHGPDGLRRIAWRVHRLAAVMATGARRHGVGVRHEAFFDTVAFDVAGRADAVVAAAVAQGYDIRRVDADTVAVALDETSDASTVSAVWRALGLALDETDVTALDEERPDALGALTRRSPFMASPVFAEHRSETAMLRWLRRLSDRDLALDRTMIPLGSCTMKLNAAAEMEPISWPAFAGVHPFAPDSRGVGYRRIFADLESWLAEITGYDAVSLQPNAGSQGELAGLLAIRGYHRSRGEAQRRVCLIPSSAHGTNAASAVMAGMDVTVVDCDEDGNVDLADLKARAAEAGDELAALMVTYPSTHGVFEPGIVAVCEIVHANGGQVYLDGANLNALVGLARPGEFGADVSHLNLHKTFCIPHGGGGPGVGPVAAKAHLAPHLPNHPLVADAGPRSGPGPVSAAPWGSAGILPIPWMYLRMMGPDGLTRATRVAILAANYVAERLDDHFPVLYRGASGRVAHECILDLRPVREATGVTVTDVAKRLMDAGIHAPTVSFPVSGTMMVEPTESESLADIDHFCDVMIAIRAEIDAISDGRWSLEESPLRRAPHTVADLSTEKWDRPYPRSIATYGPAELSDGTYRSPVGRIDEAWGDRNLACDCPSLDSYRDGSPASLG
jgi:glycine dehydrogenase